MSFECTRDLLLSTNELGVAGVQEMLEKIIATKLDAGCFFELAQMAHERSFPILMKVCVFVTTAFCFSLFTLVNPLL